MEADQLLRQMNRNADRIRALLLGVSELQARWKPAADSWSILEVINHLCDEEERDFRVRLDYILHRPLEPWPAIDPQGWVTAHGYNQRDLLESLEDFSRARLASLAWLQSLSQPDWDAAHESAFGRMRAGDMFAAWVSHDLLHMRQLVELHWAYTAWQIAPYGADYAGGW